MDLNSLENTSVQLGLNICQITAMNSMCCLKTKQEPSLAKFPQWQWVANTVSDPQIRVSCPDQYINTCQPRHTLLLVLRSLVFAQQDFGPIGTS